MRKEWNTVALAALGLVLLLGACRQMQEDTAGTEGFFEERDSQSKSGERRETPAAELRRKAALPLRPPGGSMDTFSPPQLPPSAPAASSAPVPEGAAAQPEQAPNDARAVSGSAPYNTQSIEQTIFSLTNELRRTNEQNLLMVNDSLQWAAQIRAGEALERKSHTRPDDTPYHTAMDEAGYDYAGNFHGENLCVLSFPARQAPAAVARSIFQLLAGSEGHCSNMLRTSFTQAGMGIAVRQTADGCEVACVQLFAGS